jgi:hypothetical protein
MHNSPCHDQILLGCARMQKFCICKGCTPLSDIEFRQTDNQNRHFSGSEQPEDNWPCGHCDNCTRDPTSVVQSDLTPDAKRVLGVARALSTQRVKVTAVQLAQAARGTGEKSKSLQLAPEDQVTLSLLVRPVSYRRSSHVSSLWVGDAGHGSPYRIHANRRFSG